MHLNYRPYTKQEFCFAPVYSCTGYIVIPIMEQSTFNVSKGSFISRESVML